ncbi:NUDIX hydrolase domain-like protein [Tribonema minus]|uniref:NAD(+) diphosphatase n=1 Tax=Tribonema minus TaxID=303371 RepID=A0A835YGW5_9STRA|nr:NUDIX hydrolase domain-like protein [Tribonema minus]
MRVAPLAVCVLHLIARRVSCFSASVPRRAAFYTDPDLERRGRDALLLPGALEDVLTEGSCKIMPVYKGKSCLVVEEGKASIYTMAVTLARELLEADSSGATATLIHLGAKGGHRYFGLHVPPHMPFPAPPGAQLLELRSAAEMLLDDADSGLLGLARALAAFHGATGFCPACGTATASYKLGSGRRCTAAECGAVQYPRIDPAVMMMVLSTDGSHALLGRKKAWAPGRYSCLAGFTEMSESLEQTVVREVEEEAGVAVDPASVIFVSSQPWPFPRQLMVGFFARALPAEGGALPTLYVDPKELEAAQWFPKGEVAAALSSDGSDGGLHFPGKASLARRLLQDWALGT